MAHSRTLNEVEWIPRAESAWKLRISLIPYHCLSRSYGNPRDLSREGFSTTEWLTFWRKIFINLRWANEWTTHGTLNEHVEKSAKATAKA